MDADVQGGACAGDHVQVPASHPAAFDLVLVAASAGGVNALKGLLASLPAYLPVPVVIVQHLPGGLIYTSKLDQVLQRKTPLLVKWAEDGERLLPGCVYLAPQDRETTLDFATGLLSVRAGTGAERLRPAADPLFQSAARLYGSRVLALVLSGMLTDGAEGAWRIVQAGGRVLIQDFDEAEFPQMPRAAMRRSRVELPFSVAALARILCSLIMVPGTAEWFAIGKARILTGQLASKSSA